MTLEEEGIYVRLMSYCWREGSIPADIKALSRLCKGASPEALAIVKDRFIEHPGDPNRLTHKRLQAEREKQESWRSKQSDNGKKSGEARKSTIVEPSLNHRSTAVEPSPNSSIAFASSSSSSKQEQPPSGDASLNSRMLCEKVGCFDMREQSAVTQVMDSYSRHSKKSLEESRDYLIAQWVKYGAMSARLTWVYGSAYKFFMSGKWDNPDAWPWKPGESPPPKNKADPMKAKADKWLKEMEDARIKSERERAEDAIRV